MRYWIDRYPNLLWAYYSDCLICLFVCLPDSSVCLIVWFADSSDCLILLIAWLSVSAVCLMVLFADFLIPLIVWFHCWSVCLICRFADSSDCLIPLFVHLSDSADCLIYWFTDFSDCLILLFQVCLPDCLVPLIVCLSDSSEFLILLILLISANQQSEKQLNCYPGSLLLWLSDIQWTIQSAILCTVYQQLSDLQKVRYGVCSDVSGIQYQNISFNRSSENL